MAWKPRALRSTASAYSILPQENRPKRTSFFVPTDVTTNEKIKYLLEKLSSRKLRSQARQKLLVEFRQTMTNDECVSSKKLNKKWKYQNKYQIR